MRVKIRKETRMYKSNIQTKKNIIFAGLAVVTAVVLAFSWMMTAVGASGIVSVTSNIASVSATESLKLNIKIQNDGDVHMLEVDHSVSTLPEFSVYANEADPYGADRADYIAAGATVTYSEASSEWTIDIGQAFTNEIIDNHGGEISFYFTLKDSNGQLLWGDMYNASAWPSFNFDLVEGTAEMVEGTENSLYEPVIPGVPNTSVVRP